MLETVYRQRDPQNKAYHQFKGDLTETIVWSGSGGFCVEEDEHGYTACCSCFSLFLKFETSSSDTLL